MKPRRIVLILGCVMHHAVTVLNDSAMVQKAPQFVTYLPKNETRSIYNNFSSKGFVAGSVLEARLGDFSGI